MKYMTNACTKCTPYRHHPPLSQYRISSVEEEMRVRTSAVERTNFSKAYQNNKDTNRCFGCANGAYDGYKAVLLLLLKFGVSI